MDQYSPTSMNQDYTNLLIGKVLGEFKWHEEEQVPKIHLYPAAIQEKVEKMKTVGQLPTSEFQITLFTFLHEFKHLQQYQEGKVTLKEMRAPEFRKTIQCQQLEKEADQFAYDFIKDHSISFDSRSLEAMMVQPLTKLPIVGEKVVLSRDVDLVDNVYYKDNFYSGIDCEGVDMGAHRITLLKGTTAVINAVLGSKVQIIELSNMGRISAYDSIKDKNLSNDIIVSRAEIDLTCVLKFGSHIKSYDRVKRVSTDDKGTVLQVNDTKPGDIDVLALWDKPHEGYQVYEVDIGDIEKLDEKPTMDQLAEAQGALEKYQLEKQQYEDNFADKNIERMKNSTEENL